MSAPTITFEIDGETVRSTDAAWFLVAPCGCVDGVLVVDHGRPEYKMTPRLTEDDAWTGFYSDSAERRRRDVAAGYTMRLGRLADTAVLLGDCKHTPKWGIAPDPSLEGYVWASPSRMPNASERRHLVPAETVTPGNERWNVGESAVLAICGSKRWAWFTGGLASNAPTCRRCEAKAIKTGGRP